MIRKPPPTRRGFLRRAAASLPFASAVAHLAAKDRDDPATHRNVLLILVDDLRTELGCFGYERARTPHIDRLAQSGLTFLRNYCQQAASNPSRASMLTGLRPDSTRVYDGRTHFRAARPGTIALPELFRRNGFETAPFGRIYDRPELDDRQSWSASPWIPQSSEEGAGSSWEASAIPDQDLPDGQIARAAASALADLQGSRFFAAVGFSGPGLPLVAPKRFFDQHPAGAWGGPEFAEPPIDAPPFALHGSDEIRAYSDIPTEGPVPETKAKELIRAYRACVSFTDSRIGLLLDTLDELGLAASTVVVLAGVAGSHLGELGLWSKHSNYEAATHTPLVVRAPGERNAGRKTAALVESVDLFPSLCSLCRLPRPVGLEGASWHGLFEDPKRLWKRAAYSQHPRAIPGIGPGMGYSMRTSRHRFTEWSGLDSPYSTTELYDYKGAPHEWRNLANRPEHVSLVNGLWHMLREGWQGSLPPTEMPVSSRA